MTLRRLRWLLLPLLAAVVLAVLVLPPRAMPERYSLVGALLGLESRVWQLNAREAHFRAISRARDRLRDAISSRAHGVADVLASRSAGVLRSASEPVVVVRDRNVSEATGRAWLRAAEGELRLVPRASAGGVPVIVALHTRSPVEQAAWMNSQMVHAEYQVEAGGARVCIVEVLFPEKGGRGRDRFEVPRGVGSNVLGRCALYARFGFPGPAVQRWIGLETRWNGWSSWWYWEVGPFAPQRLTVDTVPFRRPYGGGVPWAWLGCLREVDAYCAALTGLASPRIIGRAGDYFDYGYYGWSFRPPADQLVADIILDRGAEGFAKAWNSPLPPDSALHVAYGVPAGALVRQMFSRRHVPAPAAQVSAVKLLISVGWALALGALAMLLAWRREMDL